MLVLIYPCRSRAFRASESFVHRIRAGGSHRPFYGTTTVTTEEPLKSQCTLSPLPVADFGGIQHFVPSNDKFRVIFVLGGPGSGKGTQSELMKEHYPVSHQSVGQLLRDVDPNSPDAKLIQEKLKEGLIVPVQVSLNLLHQAMQQQAREQGRQTIFLVDGFPRNFDNLQGWCNFMEDKADVWSTFVYHCPLEVLQKRILERGKASGRSDDNLESLQKRFRTFEQETMPVIDQLRQSCKVVDIAGDKPLEDVWTATQELCNQLLMSDVLTCNRQLLDAVATGNLEDYENLCDPALFQDQDVRAVLAHQEGPTPPGPIEVRNAETTVIHGQHVVVSYDRVDLENPHLRESRVWVHQGLRGWRCVHVARVPQ